MITLGAQLYTIRDYIKNEKDFARSMKRISDIGYRSVQISGIDGYDPKAYRNICDANGLEIGLTHVDANKILTQTQSVIEAHQILGCNYIGLGSMPDKYRCKEWVEYFAEDFMQVATLIKDSGMKLMYHNHAFEFQTKRNGRDLLECITDDMRAELLGITLDVFWIQTAGKDIDALMQQYHDRLDCIHLKDFKATGKTCTFAEVGEGNLDFKKIIARAETCGTKYMFVEQDLCEEHHPFESLKISYNNLQNHIL